MDKMLAMKIYNVMNESISLEKNTTVGQGTKGEYKAVGEKEVLNAIKPLLKKYKLIILPVDGTIEEKVDSVMQYSKDATRIITQLKVKFLIIDAETGESVEIVGFGNGADTQDKGSGKAFTYAYKTALSKSFMLFSGEDTDNHHSDSISEETQGEAPRKVTTKQLIDMAIRKGYDEEYLCKKAKTDQVKFIKADIKIKYYDALSKLPDVSI